MANWYVWSGASGAGTGADWANAYTTLNAAAAAKAAGDVFYVAQDHAQTQATSLTINFPGTNTSPNQVYCVNRAGSVPPVQADLRTTATVAATGNNSITIQGVISECNGIIFNAGSGGTSSGSVLLGSANSTQRFVNCAMRLLGTATTARVTTNNGPGSCTIFESTSVRFGSTSQRIQVATKFLWRNSSGNAVEVAGAFVPTTLIQVNGYAIIEGVDLSNATSGLVDAQTAGNTAILIIKDCRLPATGLLMTGGLPTIHVMDLQVIRSDSADTIYRNERHSYSGAQTTETTIIRTGGASDGTMPISWKIVTSSGISWGFPFEAMPISIWNETTGSLVTLTLQGIWGGGSVPNNDDIWMDLEVLSSSSYPLASLVTTNKVTALTTAAALPAGSGTWGGSTTKFALTASFTPTEKGPITIYVRAAKPSSTFYIDPKPLIS